jgi:ubiquinone/menaquinone biosynthesis C-methylase UbiE
MQAEKASVRDYWDRAPCGTPDVAHLERIRRYAELERIRYEREPFIARFARFEQARGVKLLEVGVGAGTDHLQFARAGAVCTGVDLSATSLETARERLSAEGLTSHLQVADAEALPFPADTFELVYSWGVIHHTPDTRAAAREILRVLRPGGRFCVMVYNRHSLLALQAWVWFAALRGHPARSVSDVLAQHVESPGTKAYTAAEAGELFSGAREVKVDTVVTPYDLRVGRRRFLPSWLGHAVPNRVGWFHVVTGVK